jgi:hypothetical protein
MIKKQPVRLLCNPHFIEDCIAIIQYYEVPKYFGNFLTEGFKEPIWGHSVVGADSSLTEQYSAESIRHLLVWDHPCDELQIQGGIRKLQHTNHRYNPGVAVGRGSPVVLYAEECMNERNSSESIVYRLLSLYAPVFHRHGVFRDFGGELASSSINSSEINVEVGSDIRDCSRIQTSRLIA